MSPPSRDSQDALAALERLFHKKVISQEEGQAAARLITGDDQVVFPPALKPAREAPAPPAPEPQPAPAPAPVEGGNGGGQPQG